MKTGIFVAILATLALIAGNLAEEGEFEAWSKRSLRSYDHLSLEEESAPTLRAADEPNEFQDIIMEFDDEAKQRRFGEEPILSGADQWEAQREEMAIAKEQHQLEDGSDVETELLQAPGTAFEQVGNPELLTVTAVKKKSHPHTGISTTVAGDCEKLVKGLDTTHILQAHPECTRWMISIDNTGGSDPSRHKTKVTGGTRKSDATDTADEEKSPAPPTELAMPARDVIGEITPLIDQEQRLSQRGEPPREADCSHCVYGCTSPDPNLGILEYVCKPKP
jgi:hypothetical protein